MRRVAILCALAGAACTTEPSVTFALSFRVARASTPLSINGVPIDGGGPAPRTVSLSYDFASWPDAMQAHYLLESFNDASKLAELTTSPAGCPAGDTAETQVFDVLADGTFSLADDRCM